MTNEQPIYAPVRTPWRAVLALALLIPLVVGILVTAFAWPALESAPRDVPLAVAGPPSAAQPAAQGLEAGRPGAFDVRTVTDAAEARDLLLEREVYGAVVLGPDGPQEVLVASAASPAVAQLIVAAAGSLTPPGDVGGPPAEGAGDSRTEGAGSARTEGAAAAPAGPAVVDVAPTPEGDPRGVGLAAGAFPLTLAGVLTGSLMSLRVSGPARRLAGTGVAAALVGPVVVGVLHGWFDALGGDPIAEAGIVSLGVLAAALLVIGGHALLGYAGLGLGAATLVLLGNPLSGATSAPELLPAGWSALGQALPPGALVDALRGVSGFDGAGAGEPVLVLLAWVGAGVTAVLAGAWWRARARRRAGTGTAEPAAVRVPAPARP